MYFSIELRGRHRRRTAGDGADMLATLLSLHRLAPRRGVQTVAFCVMGNHLHLVLKSSRIVAVHELLQRVRQVHAHRVARRGLASLGPAHLAPLSDAHAVRRYVAYAHANPARARMVSDPLAWPFSSLRDAAGLRRAPWFDPAPLLDLAGSEHVLRMAGAAPSPSLLAGPQRSLPLWSLGDIQHAACAVAGTRPRDFGRQRTGTQARHSFVVAARHLGWHHGPIAAWLGVTRRHIRRIRTVTPDLGAICAVLHDPRLRPPHSGWLHVPPNARGPGLWPELPRRSAPELSSLPGHLGPPAALRL